MRLLCKIGIPVLVVSCNFSCAPSRFVKPLEKKQQVLSVSLGGPTVLFSGAPMPMPFTTIAYAYGLSSSTTMYGSMHVTSSLFGNAQGDIGATVKLHEWSNKIGLSASPALQIAYSVGNKTGFKIWPSLDLNTYVHIKNSLSYLYGGMNAWFELSKYKAHNEIQQTRMLPNLQLGYMHVKQKWQHQFELKYLGIGITNKPGIVDYIGVSGKGSFGIYYSLIRKF